MIENVELSWLNNCVPLWAWIIAVFTSPWTWSKYVNKGIAKAWNQRFGDTDAE